jgi:hypothetical protein
MSGPLADAWERVEEAMRRTPHAYAVWIAPALPPVMPYRARVELTYRPEGHKRQRTDRVDGEGLTLAEALNALADGLDARNAGR